MNNYTECQDNLCNNKQRRKQKQQSYLEKQFDSDWSIFIGFMFSQRYYLCQNSPSISAVSTEHQDNLDNQLAGLRSKEDACPSLSDSITERQDYLSNNQNGWVSLEQSSGPVY